MTSLHTQTLSEKLSCCVCASSTSAPVSFREVHSYQLMKCCDCGLVHLEAAHVNPVSFLDEVVEQETSSPTLEYWGYPEVFRKHERVFNFFFQERLDRLLASSPPSGPWLDIGSGYGLWQSFVKEKGIEIEGIEIEAKATAFCLKQGLTVSHASIEEWKSDKKYSVITMCDVLEHVKDPVAVLEKCKDLLLPGGVIYLQVPCVLGLRYPYKDSLGLPHHLWQFNPDNLKSVTIKSGFRFLKYWTGVQGVIKHYEKGEPEWWRKSLWKLAIMTKRGNRLQLLAQKS